MEKEETFFALRPILQGNVFNHLFTKFANAELNYGKARKSVLSFTAHFFDSGTTENTCGKESLF